MNPSTQAGLAKGLWKGPRSRSLGSYPKNVQSSFPVDLSCSETSLCEGTEPLHAGGEAARGSRVGFCHLEKGRLLSLFPLLQCSALSGRLGVHRKRCLVP